MGRKWHVQLATRLLTCWTCPVLSPGMVKYTAALPRESIVDVEGIVTCPEKPIVACRWAGWVEGG